MNYRIIQLVAHDGPFLSLSLRKVMHESGGIRSNGISLRETRVVARKRRNLVQGEGETRLR